MTGAGPELVIEGTRGDWPNGARTLSPRDPLQRTDTGRPCGSAPSSTRTAARCGSGSPRRPSAG